MRTSFIITHLLSAAVVAVCTAVPLRAQSDEVSTGDSGSGVGERFPATTTIFGLYDPPVLRPGRLPLSREAAPATDFRNVEGRGGLDALDLTAAERRLLRDNGLLLRAEGLASTGDAYSAAGDDIGRYITLDAMVTDIRSVAARAVAEAESGWMHDALAIELEALSQTIAASGGTNTEVVRRALAYIETGRLLVEPEASVDSRVAQLVRRERDRVVAATETGASELLGGRQIDYSIFRLPAGLDERRAELQRARLWFTRVGLPVRERDAGRINLHAVMLIARSLDLVRSEPAAGRRHEDLAALIATVTPQSDPALTISSFTRSYRLYVGRRLDSEPSLYFDDSTIQRYAVWLNRDRGTLNQGEPRLFATPPLRTAAVAVGATGTPASQEMTDLTVQIDEARLATLDGAFSLAVESMATAPSASPDRMPRYMRGSAWGRRLALLKELKDMPSGLVPATAATAGRRGSGSGSDLIYVEPLPAAWSHVAALAGYLRSGFGSERSEPAISRATLKQLEEMESASRGLAQIAAAELAGRRLSAAEQTFLAAVCERLATNADQSAAGTAMAMYVIVPVDSTGALALVRGGAIVPAGSSIDSRIAGLADPQRPADPVQPRGGSGAVRSLPALPVSAVQPSAHLTFDNGAWAPHDESEWWYTVKLGTANRGFVSIELVDAGGRPVGTRTTEWVDDGEIVGMVNPRELAPGTYTVRLRDGVGTPISSGLLAVLP